MLIFSIPFFVILFKYIYSGIGKKGKIIKHIKDWTIVIKTVKINSFEYHYESDSDWHWSSWYYIQFSDWKNNFKTDLLTTSKLFGVNKLEEDGFYEKYMIPFTPEDTKRMERNIEDKIQQLESEIEYSWFLTKQKIKIDIQILKERKKLLEDYRLEDYRLEVYDWVSISGHSENIKTFHIWDECKIYIDPEDEKNYFIDL